jgi:integrase
MTKRLQRKVQRRIGDDAPNRKSLYGWSLAELDEKERLYYGQAAPSARLDEFAARFYMPTIATQTKSSNRLAAWALNNYILPAFGLKGIPAIERHECQEFFNNLTLGKKPLKPASISSIKIVFACVLNLAIDYKIISESPLNKVRTPPVVAPVKTTLSPEELKSLYLAAEGDVRRVVILCGFLGLRIGEALACGPGDVKNHVLMVRRQLDQDGTIKETLKTPQSARDLPLPEELELELMKGEGVTFITTHLRTLKRRLEDLNPVLFHELRHTCSCILENDVMVAEPVVLRVLGKKRKDTYKHVREDHLRDALEKMFKEVMKESFVERLTA